LPVRTTHRWGFFASAARGPGAAVTRALTPYAIGGCKAHGEPSQRAVQCRSHPPASGLGVMAGALYCCCMCRRYRAWHFETSLLLFSPDHRPLLLLLLIIIVSIGEHLMINIWLHQHTTRPGSGHQARAQACRIIHTAHHTLRTTVCGREQG